MVYWLALSLKNMTQALLMNNLIIPFQGECTRDGTCLQCDIVGRLSFTFQIVAWAVVLLLFSSALKVNFLPLSSNPTSYKIKIYALRLWIIFLTSIGAAHALITTNFKVSHLSDNGDNCICSEERHFRNAKPVVRVLVCSVLITLACIGGCFLYKGSKLLSKTSVQISKKEFARRNTFAKIEIVMTSIIQHAIIAAIVVMTPIIVIIVGLIHRDVDVSPITELIAGLCIYMLFRFGHRMYTVIFGRIHSVIFSFWIQKHQLFYSSDDERGRRLSQISTDVLPPIHESPEAVHENNNTELVEISI